MKDLALLRLVALPWLPLVLAILCYTFLANCQGLDRTPKHERDFLVKIQKLIGGEMEVTVPGGRADLLLDKVVFEVERANRWKHAVGQALWYGLQTERRPGIILIGQNESDYRYLDQLQLLVDRQGLSCEILYYPDDFESGSKN